MLLWVFSLFAQEEQLKFKYFSPEYILSNEEFQISALVQLDRQEEEKFILRLITSNDFELDSVKLFVSDTLIPLEATIPENDEVMKKVYQVEVLSNDSLFTTAPFEQFIFYGKSINAEELHYHFKYQLQSAVDSTQSDYSFFYNTENNLIKVYSRSFASDNAALFKGKASLKLLDETEKNNGLLSFWLKAHRGNYSMELVANDGIDSLMSFEVNKTGLAFFKYNENLELLEDCAVPFSTWNKFEFFFNADKDQLELYLNGRQEAILNSVNISFLRNWKLNLESKNSEIYLDEIQYGIDERIAKSSNIHFVDSGLDSLTSIFYYDCDELLQDTEAKLKIEFENKETLEFVPADLPLFSPAPELTMNFFNNYYELTWTTKNAKFSKEFIVQKSTDGQVFTDLFVVEADTENAEKKYTYTDSKDLLNEVVYYRIVQLNKDNSEVYSNQLKVGQGEIEEFALDQNYPNPFNPVTNIILEVFVPGEYVISVYDLVGKKMSEIYRGNLTTGKHSFLFDGTELPSGIYFYEVVSPTSSQVMKMILTK